MDLRLWPKSRLPPVLVRRAVAVALVLVVIFLIAAPQYDREDAVQQADVTPPERTREPLSGWSSMLPWAGGQARTKSASTTALGRSTKTKADKDAKNAEIAAKRRAAAAKTKAGKDAKQAEDASKRRGPALWPFRRGTREGQGKSPPPWWRRKPPRSVSLPELSQKDKGSKWCPWWRKKPKLADASKKGTQKQQPDAASSWLPIAATWFPQLSNLSPSSWNLPWPLGSEKTEESKPSTSHGYKQPKGAEKTPQPSPPSFFRRVFSEPSVRPPVVLDEPPPQPLTDDEEEALYAGCSCKYANKHGT